MPAPVSRNEIVDFETYRERRDEVRARVMEAKSLRRILVGDHLTFLFENRETTRYQIQEMMLAERIVKESAIQHEIETYNGLLGGPGTLACSLLIAIEEKDDRPRLLAEWLPLPDHLYVRLEGGERIYAAYDREQIGDDRLSAVQYLRFDTGGRVPVAVGTDFPPLDGDVELTPAQRKAFAGDLAER